MAIEKGPALWAHPCWVPTDNTAGSCVSVYICLHTCTPHKQKSPPNSAAQTWSFTARHGFLITAVSFIWNMGLLPTYRCGLGMARIHVHFPCSPPPQPHKTSSISFLLLRETDECKNLGEILWGSLCLWYDSDFRCTVFLTLQPPPPLPLASSHWNRFWAPPDPHYHVDLVSCAGYHAAWMCRSLVMHCFMRHLGNSEEES